MAWLGFLLLIIMAGFLLISFLSIMMVPGFHHLLDEQTRHREGQKQKQRRESNDLE